MTKRFLWIEYRLEVIDGYMRPIFDGMEPELNELMWDLLLPFPVSACALLAEIKRIESGEMDELEVETPETHITCTSKTLTLKDKREGECAPLRIEMPFKEAMLLLRRWLFECAWREQQR